MTRGKKIGYFVENHEIERAADLIKKIPNSIFASFSQRLINIHDVSLLYLNPGRRPQRGIVKKEKYPASIEASRWHGLYKHTEHNSYYLIAFAEAEEFMTLSKHYIVLIIALDE